MRILWAQHVVEWVVVERWWGAAQWRVCPEVSWPALSFALQTLSTCALARLLLSPTGFHVADPGAQPSMLCLHSGPHFFEWTYTWPPPSSAQSLLCVMEWTISTVSPKGTHSTSSSLGWSWVCRPPFPSPGLECVDIRGQEQSWAAI